MKVLVRTFAPIRKATKGCERCASRRQDKPELLYFGSHRLINTQHSVVVGTYKLIGQGRSRYDMFPLRNRELGST